jgi:hypothetical protein
MSVDAMQQKLAERNPNSTPSRSSYYVVFGLKNTATRKLAVRCLVAAGVDQAEAEQLAQEMEDARAGGPPESRAGDPRLRKRHADVAVKIREARAAWDAHPLGTQNYRDPEMSLAREDIGLAYEAAVAEALTREDVAFGLYSAVKHNKDYARWIVLCEASTEAAEALLDLIIVPRASEMLQPKHRAAWCLQKMDTRFREAAADVGRRLTAGRTDGIPELIEAARDQRVEQLIRRRLAGDFYIGDEVGKIEKLLDQEWVITPEFVGVRGLIADYLADANDEGSDPSMPST